MKTFLEHRACPECGSSDNLMVYFNEELNGETWSCATPGCNNMRTDKDIEESKGIDSLYLPKLQDRKPVRGISESTQYHYGAGVSLEGDYIFPYFRPASKTLQSYKTLKKLRVGGKKVMPVTGQTKELNFFGRHTVPFNSKEVIVTSGEFDSMSAYQMTGIPSVSIPLGDSNALKLVKSELKWLERASKVYVCFDSDDSGRKAAQEVMDVLKPGKGFLVEMTLKDANEYLKQSKTAEFKQCIRESQPKITDSLFSKEAKQALLESILGAKSSVGTPTGFIELDTVFSLRPGEVTTVFADPSVGKSSFVRQICSNLAHQKKKVLVFTFEESVETYLSKIMTMYLKLNVFQSKEDIEYLRADLEKIMEYIEVANIFEPDSVKIGEAIEYAVRSLDVECIVFDNITAATSGEADGGMNKINQLYNQMVKLGREFKHSTIIVSHTKRDSSLKQGEPPSMRHGFNSGGIERFSDNVIALGRAEGTDTTVVALRKQRSTGELTQFELTWSHATCSFNEVEDYGPAKVRFNPGRKVPSSPTQGDSETSVEETSRGISSDDSTELQPRLCDTVQERERVHRSEGEVQSEGQGDPKEFKWTGKTVVNSSCSRRFPTIRLTSVIKHSRLGKETRNSSV